MSSAGWRNRIAVAALMLLCAAATEPARAAATAWVGNDDAAVRLITEADGLGDANAIEAGIEFRFGPGWHGYWRKPGDAGIAPVFDWSGSANLRPSAVSWPAPERLVIEGLQNNVYSGRVVLPVSLARLDAAVPATLRLRVGYAACSDICVPRKADLALDLRSGTATPSAEAPLIAAARQRIPGAPEAVGLHVLDTTIAGSGAQAVLSVRLRSDGAPLVAPDLFVEGLRIGSPPAPEIVLGEGGGATLRVALAETLAPGAPLTLTLVDGARAATFSATPLPFGSPWPVPLAIAGAAMLGGLFIGGVALSRRRAAR